MQFLIHNITELIALIIAILYYSHLKGSYMKWVLPFLLFVFLGELISEFQHFVSNKSSIIIQYFIGIVESLFYGYIFYNLSSRSILKKGIVYFIAASIIFYMIGLFFYSNGYSYFFSILICNGFFLALFGLTFIYTKFIDDNNTILINEPGFWIAFGVSLFFAGTSIVFSLHDFIVKNNLNLFGIKLYNFVPRILCVILYSSISIAIILCKKKTRASLEPLS